MRIALFFLCLLLWLPLPAEAKPCSPDSPKGKKCSVALKDLHPTQFGMGMVDVKQKRAEILEGGKDYLKESRAEVVIGPDGKYYLIDRHHTMRAAYHEGYKKVWADVVDNLSHLSQEEFEEEMEKRKWVRLTNESGKKMKFSDLPGHVKDLKDDPYRSLAWLVRQSDAFRKSEKPFAEFEWADYFRDRIKIGAGAEGWDEAVKEGIRLATILETEHLPGHQRVGAGERTSRRDACWEKYASFAVGLVR
jgi:hypothetical protein